MTTKRLFDIIVSILLIIFLSPVLSLISAIILVLDGWPVIFSQKRIGFKGKKFIIYKFRTLRPDCRMFFFGKFLRSTGLDELPQIFNLLKGDMRLVGPRPFSCQHVEAILKDRPEFIKRYNIVPGITGLAQIINADKKSIDDEKRAYHLDMLYIRKRSIWLDLKILVITFLEIFRARRI